MSDSAILAAIESELVRVEGYVANLRSKIRSLRQDIAPPRGNPATNAPANPSLPVDLTTAGALHPRGFWYGGTFRRCSTQIDVYLGLLRAIAKSSDDAMPRAAAALHRGGRSRRYIANNPFALFRSRTPTWAAQHSAHIVEGWYADTNLSLDQKKQLIRDVLRAAGLRDGIDVVIVWHRTPAVPDHATPAWVQPPTRRH